MKNLIVEPVGTIRNDGNSVSIALNKEFASALIGLSGFSHIQVIWWFSKFDNTEGRHQLTAQSPYRKGPNVLGVFATRSPMRPNPIALSCAQITYIDEENAEIGVTYMEAFDGTPVLDIKPYTPSVDKVEYPTVPVWCAHWPKNYETSGEFDWENEIKE